MDEHDDSKGKLTSVGCVVTLITVAIIFVVAVPLVRWRDPETGQPVPRMVAVFTPFLVGGAFHGIVSAVLRLIGLPVWIPPESERTDSDEGELHE